VINPVCFWGDKMLPLWEKKFPIVISFTPKSGCTTILKWFLEQNNLLQDYSEWVHDYREKVLYASNGYAEECLKVFTNNPDNKLIIKIIRNPIYRSISSYLHYLRWGSDAKNWSIIREIEDWKKSNGLNNQHGISFNQFLKFIISSNQSGKVLDPHFSCQYDSVQDGKVNIYIPLGIISNEIRKLEKRFNLKKIDINLISESPHNNKPSTFSNWPKNASSFPADQNFEKVLGVPNPDIFLDKETEIMIKNAYWQDFEKYSKYFPDLS
jgi:hypothetical protein